jgi:hypothetical protein
MKKGLLLLAMASGLVALSAIFTPVALTTVSDEASARRLIDYPLYGYRNGVRCVNVTSKRCYERARRFGRGY